MEIALIVIAAILGLIAVFYIDQREGAKKDDRLTRAFTVATRAADECAHDPGTPGHDLVVADHLARNLSSQDMNSLHRWAGHKKESNEKRLNGSLPLDLEDRRRALRNVENHEWQVSRLEHAMDLKIGR